MLLADFGFSRGWGSLDESVKKGKFVTKIFFQVIIAQVLKSGKKMISADVKAYVKQEIKELIVTSCNFYKKSLI